MCNKYFYCKLACVIDTHLYHSILCTNNDFFFSATSNMYCNHSELNTDVQLVKYYSLNQTEIDFKVTTVKRNKQCVILFGHNVD